MKSFALKAVFAAMSFLFLSSVGAAAQDHAPEVGQPASNFTLSTPDGKLVELSKLLEKGDVALIFLRGYPGYQCPYCQRQVHDLAKDAEKFKAKHIQLLFVYPGEASQLDAHAREFLGKEGDVPSDYDLVIDPDYKATNLYGLRWDAAHETAYPSTFLIDHSGKIIYRKISHSHGDRATTEEILAAKP